MPTMAAACDLANTDDDAGTSATIPDGALGERSNFHEAHGYYVQGVGRDTAVLPAGWESRLVPVNEPNTDERTGLCLDPHDLCLAKLAAYRSKDLMFVDALIEAGLIDPRILAERVDDMLTADPRSRASIRRHLASHLHT